MTEHQFLIIKETTDIDVLNSDLYSYDSTVFSLTPTLQKRTSDSLIRRVERFVESIPALNKAADSVKAKVEYTPRLDLISDEIKQALKDGYRHNEPQHSRCSLR